MDWNEIWNSIVTYFQTNVWNIVWFFAILIFGLIIVKLLINFTRRILNKTKMEKISQQFLVGTIKFILYLIWILLLLSKIGIEITGIITAMSAILLAVGMALENNIANLANGIIIISTHLVKKGDYIIVGGVEGSVTDINFLFATLITPDNKKVTLPNSALVNGSVTNLGANPKRRVDFTFSVAYESDTELVKKTVIDVMKSNGKVYLTPEPFCKLKYLSASSIDFFANCWVDNEDYWDVYYYVIENVYNEFKRNGISVPYNQVEVRERKDTITLPIVGDCLPERVEKTRKQKNEKFDLENVDIKKMFFSSKKKKEEKTKDNQISENKKSNKTAVKKENSKAKKKKVSVKKQESKKEKTSDKKNVKKSKNKKKSEE